MSESVDLRGALQSWPYDPDNDARITRGDDDREILQVRTPLGIEQYEMDGRPDGARPHERESLLEYHRDRLARARETGRENQFELGPSECTELFNEGTLYYFRYVRLFQLKDWIRTIRDTGRNLEVFDLVHRHAKREEDRLYLEKWRPYIIRVNSSAGIMLELDKKAYERALNIARKGLDEIEQLEMLEDETFKFERERSAAALRALATQIEKNRPVSELELLERQLRRAIERQEFERAAQLRDRIRALKKQQPC
jgi:hypothetical protein